MTKRHNITPGWFIETGGQDRTRPLIVGIGGTTRAKSSSQRALERALHHAETLGGRVLSITGPALPEGIYDPSIPDRSPEAIRLVNLLRAADGVIIASPSYHGSISGHLKNALDYTEDMRTDPAPYLDGRAVGLICCAMGWQAGGATLGTLRSITHALRGWPTPMGVVVNSGATTFDDANLPSDAAIDEQLRIMAEQVFEFASHRMSASAVSKVRNAPAPAMAAAIP